MIEIILIGFLLADKIYIILLFASFYEIQKVVLQSLFYLSFINIFISIQIINIWSKLIDFKVKTAIFDSFSNSFDIKILLELAFLEFFMYH